MEGIIVRETKLCTSYGGEEKHSETKAVISATLEMTSVSMVVY